MTVDERVARLERENLWMRRTAVLAFAAVLLVLVVAQAGEKELPDLEVRSLVLVDRAGKTRAVLQTTDDGLVIFGLLAADETPKAKFQVQPDGAAGIALAGSSGNTTAVFAISPDGLTHLTFYDKAERGRTVLAAPGLMLKDEGGEVRGLLSLKDNQPGLQLTESEGKARATLALDKKGSAWLTFSDAREKEQALMSGFGLSLHDEKGTQRLELMVAGEPHLRLMDRTGQTRASLGTFLDFPMLDLSDAAGQSRAILSALGDAPSLSIRDAKGEKRAVLGVHATPTADGREVKTAESTLTLLDAEGSVKWKAPR